MAEEVVAKGKGEDRPASASKPRRVKRPMFEDPKVDPSLPNVLLIGDSISIAYTLGVREALAGNANVFRPPVNCGPTTRGVESLDGWLGDREWAVIHFNFGLHDLKYMAPDKNLVSPDSEGAFQQVPPEAYRENLEKIVERLKRTDAVLIWRETTPVPAGAAGRIPGDARRYNEIAAEVMARAGDIRIDPFFAHAESIADDQREANVHYTPEGAQAQAEHVAEVIGEALRNVGGEALKNVGGEALDKSDSSGQVR